MARQLKRPSRLLLATLLTMLLGGCAINSSQVEPVTASLSKYDKMSCAELAQEEQRLKQAVADLSKQVDEGRAGDRVAMGVGVVFWPALFLIDGKGESVDELGRIKGELQASQDAREINGCNIPQRKVDTQPQSDKVAQTEL